MNLKRTFLCLAMSAALGMVCRAEAILFPIAGVPSYTGITFDPLGDNKLHAVNLPVNLFFGNDSGLSTSCTAAGAACQLSFTTGTLLSFNPVTGTWIFSPGGSITLFAPLGVKINGALIPSDVAQNIFSGFFLTNIEIDSSGGSNPRSLNSNNGFLDNKIADVATFYAGPAFVPLPWNGSIGLQFNIGAVGSGGAFTSTSLPAGNSALNNPAPEPASIGIVGGGLGLLLFGAARRRFA